MNQNMNFVYIISNRNQTQEHRNWIWNKLWKRKRELVLIAGGGSLEGDAEESKGIFIDFVRRNKTGVH